MNKLYLKSIFAGCLVVIMTANSEASTGQTTAPHHPFPQFGSMSPYTLNDGTTAIYPSATSDSKNTAVKNYYDQWKTLYLASAAPYKGHGMNRIRAGKGGDDADTTFSEGQGYGMIIIVMMAGYDPNAQEIFDNLFWYAKAYPSTINPYLMSWRVNKKNEPGQAVDDSAFDGDADIALALILAAEQWGNEGPINYTAEANIMIDAIKTSTIGPNSYLPMLGDWVTPQITTKAWNQWTPRTSDFMLDNFHTFAFTKPTEAAFWNTVVTNTHATIQHLQDQYSPITKLLPDFTQYGTSIDTIKPASPNFLEGEHDGDYSYNAARTPWRIGVDALLNQDGKSLAEVRGISHWIQTKTGGNVDNIYAGYTLAGAHFVQYNSSAFTAPFGVAAMTGGASQQAWLDAIYNNVKVLDPHNEDYYEHTISLLSLLVMTGNYWNPHTFNLA